MISFAQPQTTTRRNRQTRTDAQDLLLRVKVILSSWHRFHQMSVSIGKYEKISDSGVIQFEIEQCRGIVESADRLCAEIDQMTGREIK